MTSFFQVRMIAGFEAGLRFSILGKELQAMGRISGSFESKVQNGFILWGDEFSYGLIVSMHEMSTSAIGLWVATDDILLRSSCGLSKGAIVGLEYHILQMYCLDVFVSIG